MNASNWVGDNRDMSPDRNNRYHLDNVGLQLGLGPLQLLGVSLVGDFNRQCFSGQRWLGLEKGNSQRIPVPKDGIQQTVDGIPIRKVYITNIGIEVQRHEMFNIFGSFGTIINVFLGVSKNDNLKKFAFITYSDPKDAARVLIRRKFQDARGRNMYATAADSWHQPKEDPNGEIIWNANRRPQTTQEEDNEEDDEQVTDAVHGQIETVVNEEGLNVLNDDCLMSIFSFLSYKEVTGIERVCKRWQALSYRIWKCLHELNFNKPPFNDMKTTTPMLEQYLRRCGQALTVLDLVVSRHEFNETTLAVIAKYCSNLEVLRVANIYVGNRSLAHLGRSCPKLKQLVLDGCAKFNDTDLLSLLPKCPELSHLDLSHSNSITGKCLANVEGPITTLTLCNCPAIEANYLITGLQRMSSTLESLTLSACNNLRSSEVDKIVMAVPNLTSFSLCHCFPQFDLKTLSPIGQLSKLTSLDLNFNNAVNDAVLGAIVEGCDYLTSIKLSGSGGGCAGVLSERGISMMARLRRLTDLDISYLDAASNTALKNISVRSTKLKRLICRGCPQISDDGTVQIVTMCNDLELFDLSGCQKVADRTVTAACTSVKMRTNNVPLKLLLGGTSVLCEVVDHEVPQLTVDMTDFSEEHLRPDFIDDMFFAQSDSEEEEDLDDLCERIGCDCDFEYDDTYDPTLFPCDFDDDTPKFGASDDAPDMCTTHWIHNIDDFDYDCENWDQS